MEQKKKKNWIWIAAALVLVLVLILLLTQCGGNDPEWKEHYELGLRYLSEGNYEEAILSFTAAIEIDPNVSELYVSRGEAYVMGAEDLVNREEPDYDKAEDYLQKAESDFNKAQELDPDNEELSGKFDEIRDLITQLEKLTGKKLVEVLEYTELGTLLRKYQMIYNEQGDLTGYAMTTYDQLSYTDGEDYYYESGNAYNTGNFQYVYDENGNLISMTNGDNIAPTYEYHYDEEGVLTGWTYTEVWGEEIYFTIDFTCEYDEQGRLIRVDSEEDTEVYTYDEFGRISSVEVTLSGYDCSYPGVYQHVYTYNESGRLDCNTVTTPYGTQIIYDYDDFRCMVHVKNSYDGYTDEYAQLNDALGNCITSFNLTGYTTEIVDGYLMRVLLGDKVIYEFRYAALEETLEAQQDLSQENVRRLYKEFFNGNYRESDIVYLADVTHDGMEDMLVVHFSDAEGSTITGTVYTVENGLVVPVYSNSGSSFHVGGFYGWYLIPVEGTSYYNLCEETFGMWQGFGVLTFEEYSLDNQGNRTSVELLKLDSEEEGNHNEWGMVTDEAWNRYVTQLNAKLAKCYDIYHSSSEGTGSKPLTTDADTVLGT